MRTVLRMCLTISCLFLWLGVLRAEKLDRIVAVVNGDIILYSELQESIKRMLQKSPEVRMDDPKTKGQLERELLQQLVRERLAEQEAKRLKINITKSDVDEAIETVKRENQFSEAQLDQLIKQMGQTREQFRESVKKELERSRLLEKVLKSKTIVTNEQVDAFLKSKSVELPQTKERRRLAMIFLPVPQGAGSKQSDEVEKLAKDILGQLKSGGDFGKLAREHSKGPSAGEGGDIGYVATDELAPYIEEATRGLGKDEISKLVKTAQGYYIFRVLDVQKERILSGESGAREAARRKLYEKELSRKFEEWVHELESKAFIEISL